MELRTITKDGEPWFVAADICKALGLYMSGGKAIVSNIGKYIGDSERKKEKIFPSSGGNPHTLLLSESALYKLVMRSTRQESRRFQDWVTSVVLPAIRKDGAYVMGEEKVATGEMSEDDLIAKAFFALQAKAKRLEAERVVHIEKLAAVRAE